MFRVVRSLQRAMLLAFCAMLMSQLSWPAVAQISIKSPEPAIAFSQFPVAAEHVPASPLSLRTAGDWSFRTRLREAYQTPSNFAGHYVLATWGCGTDCEMGAVIDQRNGRVVWLPGSVCCASVDFNYDVDRFGFRADSSLLILRGRLNEAEGTGAEHYYRIIGDRLVHLRDVALPPALPDNP